VSRKRTELVLYVPDRLSAVSLPSAGADRRACANLRSSASLKPNLPGAVTALLNIWPNSLTRPDCLIDAADFGHFRLVGELFGAGKALLLGLVVGCLDRIV
jgi:hypothetical protein